MPFKTPITVKTVVNNIQAKKYLLPNIQRELVWDIEKITKLFDSMMRDYPIGSFLFWNPPQPSQRMRLYIFFGFVSRFAASVAITNQSPPDGSWPDCNWYGKSDRCSWILQQTRESWKPAARSWPNSCRSPLLKKDDETGGKELAEFLQVPFVKER